MSANQALIEPNYVAYEMAGAFNDIGVDAFEKGNIVILKDTDPMNRTTYTTYRVDSVSQNSDVTDLTVTVIHSSDGTPWGTVVNRRWNRKTATQPGINMTVSEFNKTAYGEYKSGGPEEYHLIVSLIYDFIKHSIPTDRGVLQARIPDIVSYVLKKYPEFAKSRFTADKRIRNLIKHEKTVFKQVGNTTWVKLVSRSEQLDSELASKVAPKKMIQINKIVAGVKLIIEGIYGEVDYV